MAAPAALAPPPGHPRFALLDSLRAIAAFAVLFQHVGEASGFVGAHSFGVVIGTLDAGVSVFFVLSGFLLFRPFFSGELSDAPIPRLRDYTRRRLLRIVPAYWLALTVLAIYPGLPGVFSADWWRYYGFMQVYTAHTAVRGIGVAWTLCVEISFYLLLPVYAIAMRRATRRLGAGGRVRAHLLVLGALALASLGLRLYTLERGHFSPLGQSVAMFFDWFALGMALAVLSVAMHGREHPARLVRAVVDHPAWCWLIAAAFYAGDCLLLASTRNYLHYSLAQQFLDHVLRGPVAFFLVAPAVFGDWAGGWPRRVLSWRWLAWLGLISYGIYLWHLNLLLLLAGHGVSSQIGLLLTTVGAAVIVAAASYHLVERPILRWKEIRWRGRHA